MILGTSLTPDSLPSLTGPRVCARKEAGDMGTGSQKGELMSREGPRGWWASALGRSLTLTPTPAGKGPLQARVYRHD